MLKELETCKIRAISKSGGPECYKQNQCAEAAVTPL